MTRHRAIAIAVGVVALVAAHAIVLQGVAVRIALPAAGVAVVVAIAVVSHGALLWARFRH